MLQRKSVLHLFVEKLTLLTIKFNANTNVEDIQNNIETF